MMDLEEKWALEKCTRQPVPNVTMNVKYHSSLQKENQYSAETATERKGISSA